MLVCVGGPQTRYRATAKAPSRLGDRQVPIVVEIQRDNKMCNKAQERQQELIILIRSFLLSSLFYYAALVTRFLCGKGNFEFGELGGLVFFLKKFQIRTTSPITNQKLQKQPSFTIAGPKRLLNYGFRWNILFISIIYLFARAVLVMLNSTSRLQAEQHSTVLHNSIMIDARMESRKNHHLSPHTN